MEALEGSLNANLGEKSPRYYTTGVIFTLDPTKFDEKKQQRLDISGLQSFAPRIWLHNQSSLVLAERITYDKTQAQNTVTRLPPCPPDTKAFLYYSVPPERPRIAGRLRLRVASRDDFASFEGGSDLLLTTGQPWSRPLFSLPKYYVHLYEKLREERLIPDDLDTVLSTLDSKRFRYRWNHLFTLNDTFILDFSRPELRFPVITEQGMEKLPFRNLLAVGRFYSHRPYTGSALARLERSKLPEHKGTRSVVLRFLKIITPVKCVIPHYDGYLPCPKEGELLQRSRKYRSVWSVNIDKSEGVMIPGLRLLWDT